MFRYLLVLLELDVHIPSHFRKLGRAIALPEEVAIANLQFQQGLDAAILARVVGQPFKSHLQA